MDGATGFGVTALVNIMITLFSIGVCWWALMNLRIDLFLKDPKGTKAKVLYVILSVVLGHGLASFLIDYFGWSGMLSHLFG